MVKKIKEKKLITLITTVFITVVFFGIIMAYSSDYAKPAYEEYINTIVERHVDNGNTYVTLTDNYRKYNDKDVNIEKVLKKHNEAFTSEITVLIADKLTEEEFKKVCENLYIDLGRNHVKCDISICMVDKEDLKTSNPDKLFKNNTMTSNGRIN